MLLKKSLLAVFVFIMVSCSDSNELSQWRGPDRDGKYPQTGLLNQWPEEGPQLLWSYEGLGAGLVSMRITGRSLLLNYVWSGPPAGK